jgi:hypothetical protein
VVKYYDMVKVYREVEMIGDAVGRVYASWWSRDLRIFVRISNRSRTSPSVNIFILKR